MSSKLQMSREELLAFLGGARGDHLDEISLIALHSPDVAYLLRRTSGYVHSYDGLNAPDQVLSVQMRELIALCQLCAKGEERLATYHLQRLYKLGVSDNVLIEAAEAISPIVGWSTIFLVARIILAEKPNGSAPAALVPFPELAIGRNCPAEGEQEGWLDHESWTYVASLDPELAARAGSYVEHCRRARFADDGSTALGPGARELIAIPALCAHGAEKAATQHILRAYRYGLSRRQVLEAISCVLPMTGALTLQIGARAMMAAEAQEQGARRPASDLEPPPGGRTASPRA